MNVSYCYGGNIVQKRTVKLSAKVRAGEIGKDEDDETNSTQYTQVSISPHRE